MTHMRADEVFSPSGYPTYSYVQRRNYVLKLLNYLEQPQGVVIEVSGPSQTGKTVLVNRCLEEVQDRVGEIIRINAGGIKTMDDFWTRIAVELEEKANISGISVGVAGFELGVDRVPSDLSDPETRVRLYFKQRAVVLVIDDFHQIPVTTRSDVILELKGLIEAISSTNRRPSKAIVIFVPTREMRSANLWADMQAGRVRSIELPLWNATDLQRIAATQFNKATRGGAVFNLRRLAYQCFGLPSAMQAFCLEYCNQHLSGQVPIDRIIQIDPNRLPSVFQEVGDELWRISNEHIYNELTTGSALLPGNTSNLQQLRFLSDPYAGNINQMIWYALTARRFTDQDQDDLLIEQQVDIPIRVLIRRLYEIVDMTGITEEEVIACVEHMSEDALKKYNKQLESETKPRDPVFEYDTATVTIKVFYPSFLVALRHAQKHRRRFTRVG